MKNDKRKSRRKKILMISCLLAVLFLILASSYSAAKKKSENDPESPKDTGVEKTGLVEKGDIVLLNYSFSDTDGKLLFSNKPGSVNSYDEYRTGVPLEVLAGYHDNVPGVDNAVIGMKTGDKKKVFLKSADAFGPRNDNSVVTLPSVKKIPRKSVIPLNKYIEQFRSQPEKGDIIHILPYFSHQVTDVRDDSVVLESLVDGPFTSKDEFGETRIVPGDEFITLILQPEKGALFMVGSAEGRIVSTDKDSFTVDCNHPLAGRDLILAVDILSIIKASAFKDLKISWIEDHDGALKISKEHRKPAVVVLYADWCQWCKKLFNESLKDPRVLMFSNDFDWIRANSDIDRSLKIKYGQDGFPFIVFIDADGRITGRTSGFKYACQMRDELERAMHSQGIVWMPEDMNMERN